MSTAGKVGSTAVGGAVVGGAAAAAASAGWSWIEIGLTALIAVGIITAIVFFIKKVRS
jgi:hypothetical protein